jgi:hypothetical protein
VWKVSAYIVDISVDGLGQVAPLLWAAFLRSSLAKTAFFPFFLQSVFPHFLCLFCQSPPRLLLAVLA